MRTTTFVHARALLLCDAGPHGSPCKVADVAEALGVTSRTIEHLKERFVEEGMDAALERKPRAKPPQISFDGAFDARLTALACSSAPAGRARWTVRLLAEKVVELKIAPKGSTGRCRVFAWQLSRRPPARQTRARRRRCPNR